MRVLLSDAFDLQMGKTPSRNTPQYWGGTNKWVSIADIGNSNKYINSTKECITDEGVKESGIKVVPKGTVIMSFKLSLGKTAITSEDMYTNEAIMAFIDKHKYSIDTDFLFHLLSGTDWSVGTNKAVLGLTLNKATLSQKQINIPPLPEQRHIAAVLDKVSELIALRKRQLDLLDEMVKARFVEMFGDPVRNEKGWELYPLCKYLTVVGGYAFKSDLFLKTGIPVLRIGNINTGHFQPTNMVYWTDDHSLDKYAIYPGDLVMSLTGTVGKDDYGNVCILDNSYSKYYLNQRNAKLEISADIDKMYLSQILRISAIKKQLTGISRGVRQANISNNDILNLIIPIPPIELQTQFADFVQQVDKSKAAVQQALEKLNLLKSALMQEYFG